jgi:hypothetical protein
MFVDSIHRLTHTHLLLFPHIAAQHRRHRRVDEEGQRPAKSEFYHRYSITIGLPLRIVLISRLTTIQRVCFLAWERKEGGWLFGVWLTDWLFGNSETV